MLSSVPSDRDVSDVASLLNDTITELAPLFDQMEWAEDEIAAAGRRNRAVRDLLFHSFRLLNPTSDHMRNEALYRAHCRELLRRVVAGQDTRPATAAEICALCSRMSHVAPLTSPAVGLYARMWAQVFPQLPSPLAELGDYERLFGERIDDLEATSRRKLTVPDRVLGEITCEGRHHGRRVTCRYDTPQQLPLIA